jgi:hypothetical protein
MSHAMAAKEGAVVRLAAFGVLLAVVPSVALAVNETTPAVVTTDTPEYCRQLIDRVGQLVSAATVPPPVAVGSLSREGQRLCDQGLTRPGILRLRRALMLLERQPPP